MDPRLAAARATRWDRLVAVLECVEPQQVIEASRILERAKKLHVSDVELFSLLAMHYQDGQEGILFDALNFEVLALTWISWAQEVHRSYVALRGGSPKLSEDSALTTSNSAASLDGQGFSRQNTCPFGNSLPTETHAPPVARVNLSGRKSRAVQSPYQRFDLVSDTTSDGILDSLRDGTTLYALVLEALEHSRQLQSIAQEYRDHPETITAVARELLFPSLPCSGGTPIRPCGASASPKSAKRAPGQNASKKVDFTSFYDERRNVVEVERTVGTLNAVCEQYLHWNPDEHQGEPFFLTRRHDLLAATKNEDELNFLLRLHWLAVELFLKINDPQIVPVPPHVSFILMQKGDLFFSASTRDTEELENDLAVGIATKCSCLPHSNRLSVTKNNRGSVDITHPTHQPQGVNYPCTVVSGETFLYVPRLRGFYPLWQVLRYRLRHWDDQSWFFDMSDEQQKTMELLLGTQPVKSLSSATNNMSVCLAEHGPSSSVLTGSKSMAHQTKAITTFDLTMQSSSVHRLRGGQLRSGEMERSEAIPSVVSQGRLSPAVSMVRQNRRADPNAHLDGVRGVSDSTSPLRTPPLAETSPVISPTHASVGAVFEAESVPDFALTQRPHPSTAFSNPLQPVELGEAGTIASCTLSVVHSSQAIIATGSRPEVEDSVVPALMDDFSEAYFSEAQRRILNFSATVVEEGRGVIAVKEHCFRVSGRPIGKGAFGAVYQALDLETGIIMAVKQSRYCFDNDRTNLNWRELQTCSMLPSHPNVITFYGASKEVETHQLLLVLEYASGGSIMNTYRSFRPIPEHLFYHHARGIALGLKHLHDHDVIHGDMKPENVLTRSNGTVAISDFGCSRLHRGSSSEFSAASSDSWLLVGTAAYMPPEVIANEPSPLSDVWSYACTLLTLWLDELPWSHTLDEDVIHQVTPLMYQIVHSDLSPFDNAQIARAPRWLQKIARRSFERDVQKRATTNEVLSILSEYNHTPLV